jgi:hypothetical protein
MSSIRRFACIFAMVCTATALQASELSFDTTYHSSNEAIEDADDRAFMGRDVVCAEGNRATIAEIQAWVQRCNYNVCPHECGSGFYVRARQWANGRWNVVCECD